MPGPRADVDVVLLAWREPAAQLEACTRSLADALGPAWRGTAVLVENGGTTAGRAALRHLPGEHVVLCARRNLGFARAMDLALPACPGTYALLVNTDGRLDPGAVDALLSALEERPDAVAAAPAVHGEGEDGEPPGPARDVDELAGTALLLRRRRFLDLGAFDPLFFFYNEDADASRRVRAAGGALLRVPAVRFVHDRSGRTARGRFLREHHYARTAAALTWVWAPTRRAAARRLVTSRRRALVEHLRSGDRAGAAAIALAALTSPAVLARAEARRRRPWDGARLRAWARDQDLVRVDLGAPVPR